VLDNGKIVQVGHYKINDFSDIQNALNKTKDHQTTIKIVRDR
jgi:regulator of sigma E protease